MNGESKTHKDENGYWRFKDSGILVHRWNAFKHLAVHHLDGNVNNNEPYNLLSCTPQQHKMIEERLKVLKERIKELEEAISIVKKVQ